MYFLLVLPTLLSALALAAHFLRAGNLGMVLVSLLAPALLLIARRWALRCVQAGLLLAACTWLSFTWGLAELRLSQGREWHRMVVIMLGVAAFTGLAAALLQAPRFVRAYPRKCDTAA